MRPVRQTADNCMAACLASILEIPLGVVPDYQAIRRADGSWLNALNVWATKHHGIVYEETERRITPHVTPVGWHLINVGVPTKRIHGGHSIVGFNGVGVWDPASGREPPRFLRPDTWGLLVEATDEQLAMFRRDWPRCLCGACLSGRAYPGAPRREARCIGCGCRDTDPCRGGCSWIHVEREHGWGVCSSCIGVAESLELVRQGAGND